MGSRLFFGNRPKIRRLTRICAPGSVDLSGSLSSLRSPGVPAKSFRGKRRGGTAFVVTPCIRLRWLGARLRVCVDLRRIPGQGSALFLSPEALRLKYAGAERCYRRIESQLSIRCDGQTKTCAIRTAQVRRLTEYQRTIATRPPTMQETAVVYALLLPSICFA